MICFTSITSSHNQKGKEMNYQITIRADHNDGDYLTKVSKISEEDLKIIKPLIAAIKAKATNGYHSHNYQTRDHMEKPMSEIYNFPEEVFDRFEEFIPNYEYGIHTIDSITTIPWHRQTKLL